MNFPSIKKEYMIQIEEMEKCLKKIHEEIDTLKESWQLEVYDMKQLDEIICSMRNNLNGIETTHEKSKVFRNLCIARQKTNELLDSMKMIDNESFEKEISDLVTLGMKIDERLSGL